jgi:hypothetical protein
MKGASRVPDAGRMATVFYYFDPCGCNLVVRHVPWLVRLIDEPAVCIGAGAMALLIRNWAMDDPEAALGTIIFVVLPGALAYWLTASWIVVGLLSGVTVFVLARIGSKENASATG